MTGRKPGGRNTATGGQLLENSVDVMHALGFQVYDSPGQFDRAVVVPERYVIRNYPEVTIYGTRGKKEAFICATGVVPELSPSPDGRTRVLIEAKHQATSGSVDEKIPFVWSSFLASEVPNWVLIMGGAHWQSSRGKAVATWARSQEPPAGRTWTVASPREFIRLATRAWGTPC